jgi:raffinose/stachyose/melibiose transport system substrate-binding protein
MKRAAILVVLAVVVLSGVFATGTTEEGADSGRSVTLAQMVSQGWTQPAHEELAAMFTEETGISIDWQVTPADQHHDLLRTKLNAGEAPDIFWIQSNPFAIKTEIDPEKNAIDFSDEAWVAVMEPTRLPSVSYNGKVYGQTFWNGSVEFPMLYNKTLFAELGLSVPTNYAEFKNAAATILAAGITPIYEHVPSGWHHVLFIMMIGGAYEQDDPGLFDRLNNNEQQIGEVDGLLDAISQMDEFARLGYFGEDYMSNTGSDVRQQLAERTVAMYCGGVSTPRTIAEEYPDSTDEWGIFLIPFADNQTFPNNPAGPTMFGYSQSPYEEEIREYFRFMARIDNLQYLLDNHPEWTNIDLSPEAEAQIQQHYSPIELEFVASLRPEQMQYTIMQTGVKYMNEQWMDMGADLEAMFVGAMTPEDVMAAIQERRDRLARAQSDPAWD